MNKSYLKSFAIEARNELIDRIKQKAFEIGITEEKAKKANIQASDAISVNGKLLDKSDQKQRNSLLQKIKEKGMDFDQVIEEVAYTWFNRLTALRFMEANDFLPTGIRVLSATSGGFEPDIIKEALTIDFELNDYELDKYKEKVYEFKDKNDIEGLFKYLLIKQCNSLNTILPFLFEKIEDYTEILFPDGLLREGSVLRKMTDTEKLPEEDWKDVEIIGWLYQYYISEKKDEVFADLKKNIKITKENIPAATQLFTPHWIVRYMVENSLGRIWTESNPDTKLKDKWKYYLEEAPQEEDVKKQLEEIRYKNVNPEEITFLDPCCGSGHILVYAFDVFYDMYLDKGYVDSEIPKLILEKNLYGLDIDERAAQLASFAVMMKARERSRRVFRQNVKLNICAISESNWMNDKIVELLVDRNAIEIEKYKQRETLNYLKDVFWDAKEYGSILDVKELDLGFVEKRIEEFRNNPPVDIEEMLHKDSILENMFNLVLQGYIMGKKYDVVCTNPPYMGNKGMSIKLTDYLDKKFNDSKSDLFAVFIEKCLSTTNKDGYSAMITQHSWMFLSSFEIMRKKLIDNFYISSMVHLGPRAFEEISGEVVQATSFVIKK